MAYLCSGFAKQLKKGIDMNKKLIENEDKAFEKFYGKKVCTENLNIEGFEKPLTFDIYDGYAICRDYKGHTYDMTYPQLKIVKESTELSDEVLNTVGSIDSIDEINVLHVLMTFNTLYKDGVEILEAC